MPSMADEELHVLYVMMCTYIYIDICTALFGKMHSKEDTLQRLEL